MRNFRLHARGVSTVLASMLVFAGAFGPTVALATASDSYNAPAPAPMTEAAAKKDITDANYTNVTNLHKVKDGWAANAKSLGSPVSLLVTDMGDIEQQ